MEAMGALVLALTLTGQLPAAAVDDSSSDDSAAAGRVGHDEAGEAAFIDPADDCTSTSTMGVSGDTIKVGTIRPQSGPYSIYDQ